MAGLELNVPDDYLKQLIDTSFEEIADQALKEAAPTLQESIVKSIKASMQPHGDSELLKSIRTSKPKATKTDAYIVNVYPSGNARQTYYYAHGKKIYKYTVSNALKAIWLEYGNREGRQPPRPWLAHAVNDSTAEVMRIIQKVWEAKTGQKL